MLSLEGKALLGDSSFRLAKKPKTCQHSLRMTLKQLHNKKTMARYIISV